jgi:phospholipid-translocating ATPase
MEEIYKILKVIEFSSERKMMSVIAKVVDSGKTYVFSKGADSAILPKLQDKQAAEKATRTVSTISKLGLRTLCYAVKEINEIFDESELEQDLNLLGITGVEDELQEDVAKCIKDFREAGIKFWMLTGDKGETALEIGYSCGLFERNSKILQVQEEEDSFKDKFLTLARNSN